MTGISCDLGVVSAVGPVEPDRQEWARTRSATLTERGESREHG